MSDPTAGPGPGAGAPASTDPTDPTLDDDMDFEDDEDEDEDEDEEDEDEDEELEDADLAPPPRDAALFQGMVKLQPVTAAELIAHEQIELETSIHVPADTALPDLLARLDGEMADVDRLRLLAHALPVREAAWWACMAARDMLIERLAKDPRDVPPCLAVTEAWVFQPNEENRVAARAAMEAAHPTDETQLCAMVVCFSDGRLGPGELQQFPAPPQAAALAVFALQMKSMCLVPEKAVARAAVLVERGLDIARGGDGVHTMEG
ncbi:MAG: hypothetical protein AAF677_07575 [Pseudomonadota bacterium]